MSSCPISIFKAFVDMPAVRGIDMLEVRDGETVTGPDLLGCCSLIKIEMMKYWNGYCEGGGM
jgi:hypothetical protein